MRNIKFRGKDIVGNWYHGTLSILKQDVGHVKKGAYISNSVGMPFAYQVRPETICQYIGHKDKNGTEIYENDIINNFAFRDNVVFEGGCFVCENSRPDQFGMKQPVAVHNELEVIGNKFDNPELARKHFVGQRIK